MVNLCTYCEYFSSYAQKIDSAVEVLRLNPAVRDSSRLHEQIVPSEVSSARKLSRRRQISVTDRGQAVRAGDLSDYFRPLLENALSLEDLINFAITLRLMCSHCSSDLLQVSGFHRAKVNSIRILELLSLIGKFLTAFESLYGSSVCQSNDRLIDRADFSFRGSEDQRCLLIDMIRLSLNLMSIFIQDLKAVPNQHFYEDKEILKTLIHLIIDVSLQVLSNICLGRDDIAVVCMTAVSAYYVFVHIEEGENFSKISSTMLLRLSGVLTIDICSLNQSINDYADKMSAVSGLATYYVMKSILCIFGECQITSTIENWRILSKDTSLSKIDFWQCQVDFPFFAVYPSICVSLCKHESVDHRICGIQLINEWLNQASSLVDKVHDDRILLTYVEQILLDFMRSLLTCWIYPIQIVNRLVPDVYQRVIQQKSTLLEISQVSSVEPWVSWINEVFNTSSPTHRCRYQALSYLLSCSGVNVALMSVNRCSKN